MCHEVLLRSGHPGGCFLLILFSPFLRFVLFFFFHFEIIENLKAQRTLLDPCSDSNICFIVFSHIYMILSDLFESRLPTSRLYSVILQHAFLKNKAVNYLDHSLVIKFNIDVMLLSISVHIWILSVVSISFGAVSFLVRGHVLHSLLMSFQCETVSQFLCLSCLFNKKHVS